MGLDLRLRRAAHVLHRGGVVAYPTESVFGLGCDPLSGDAVARILELKQRPVTAGLIVIGADREQVRPWLVSGMSTPVCTNMKKRQPLFPAACGSSPRTRCPR